MFCTLRAHLLTGLLLFGLAGASTVWSSPVLAQDETAVAEAAPEASEEVVEAEEVAEAEVVAFDAADSAYTINTLIMFICAVLVLFMQAGFAMVEVGLNSAKNTVNILAKNVMDLSVGVILFLFVGFALMYPGEWLVDGYLGEPSSFVSRDNPEAPGDYSSSADFLFQVIGFGDLFDRLNAIDAVDDYQVLTKPIPVVESMTNEEINDLATDPTIICTDPFSNHTSGRTAVETRSSNGEDEYD